MQYDNEFLRQINQSVNLVDYIGQHIELKKHGKDYFGHCPLHVDKTPSFSVNPSKNLFYCFSCSRSGGIIQYLKEYEELSFEEAVEKAARLANMDLSQMCQSKTVLFLKNSIGNAQPSGTVSTHKILPPNEIDQYEDQIPQEWVDEGIDPDVMKLFGIRIDQISNRIVYPVYDLDGNLINIKGRTRYTNYKEMKLPKYINYYRVGTMDYFQSLNLTYPYVKQKNEIIVFESIKSVMKAYGWGFKNCVSAETHNMSKEQIELLIQLHVNVVLAFDADVRYSDKSMRADLNKLKMFTNVYVIEDKNKLLGGAETKNAPADCGEEIWHRLYREKRKVV